MKEFATKADLDELLKKYCWWAIPSEETTHTDSDLVVVSGSDSAPVVLNVYAVNENSRLDEPKQCISYGDTNSAHELFDKMIEEKNPELKEQSSNKCIVTLLREYYDEIAPDWREKDYTIEEFSVLEEQWMKREELEGSDSSVSKVIELDDSRKNKPQADDEPPKKVQISHSNILGINFGECCKLGKLSCEEDFCALRYEDEDIWDPGIDKKCYKLGVSYGVKRFTKLASRNCFCEKDAFQVSEWVTDLWYSRLTPDKQGPDELEQIINGVLEEISARMRNVNLIDLLTRDLIIVLCNNLELFRTTQAKVEKQELGLLTTEHRDMEHKRILASESKLHPALFSAESEHKVLQTLMDGLISFTLRPEDLQCSLFRYIARELLASAVIRPVLNLANPRFINERIEAVVIARIKGYNLSGFWCANNYGEILIKQESVGPDFKLKLGNSSGHHFRLECVIIIKEGMTVFDPGIDIIMKYVYLIEEDGTLVDNWNQFGVATGQISVYDPGILLIVVLVFNRN